VLQKRQNFERVLWKEQNTLQGGAGGKCKARWLYISNDKRVSLVGLVPIPNYHGRSCGTTRLSKVTVWENSHKPDTREQPVGRFILHLFPTRQTWGFSGLCQQIYIVQNSVNTVHKFSKYIQYIAETYCE